ncbi:hypothetical protein F5X97DRAFT_202867 [Nemania serpens]|nr:hypothetical protein F5X97DRAFT_202867 [Nemania serpens]
MKTKLIVASFFFLVANVLAGGYAGALERVWLFYAYQIDGLNDPADQTLGWKCLSWDEPQNQCRPSRKGRNGWTKCVGTGPGKRCTFSQLLNFVGGADRRDAFMADSNGNLLPLEDLNPDPEETAKNVYAHFKAQKKSGIPDWQGRRIILNGDDNYVRSIRRISAVVTKAANDGKNTGANKQVFEMFAETTTQIKTARVGDHGRHLVPNLRDYLNRLNYRDITVETESVEPGHSPVDPTIKWETVNWERMASKIVTSPLFDNKWQALKTLSYIKSDIYTDTSANNHRVAIKAFKTAETKAKGCI